MTKTKTFNNRALELVRNFVIIDKELNEGQNYSFNLSEDPFDMTFIVNNGHLFAAVNIHATQGEQRTYEIASIDHTERLLYMADMNKTQSEFIEDMKNELKDDYFLYLLEEYISTDVFSVPADEMEFASSGNADLVGHIEQLHINATTINEPDKGLVRAMYELTVLMNSEAPTMEDFETFKTTLEEL